MDARDSRGKAGGEGTACAPPTFRPWLLATAVGGVAGNLYLATVLGLWLGGGAAFGVNGIGMASYMTAVIGIPLVGAAIGLAIGLAQWRLLRPADVVGRGPGEAGEGARWVGASAVGALVAWWPLLFAIIFGSANGREPVADTGAYVGEVTATTTLIGGVAGGVCGLFPGITQGLILRRLWPHAPRRVTALWVAAAVAGWGTGWAAEGAALGLLAARLNVGSAPAALLVGGLLVLAGAWGTTGALTGFALRALAARDAG